MEVFKKLLEQAGFSLLINADSGSIEIKDLYNNNNLLHKSQQEESVMIFRGSGNREVVMSLGNGEDADKSISITCGNGLVIKQTVNVKKTEYELCTTLADGTNARIIYSIILNDSKRTVAGIKVRIVQTNNEQQILANEMLYIGHGMLTTNVESSTLLSFSDYYDTIAVEECDTTRYLDIISDFCSKVQLTANNSIFQDGFKIIEQLFSQNIEYIFTLHKGKIDDYIKFCEEKKLMKLAEYQQAIANIDSDIERLVKISQGKPKIQ